MNSAVCIRQAVLADVARIAPLFDAYRVFYQQPSDAKASEQFIHERLARGESIILLAEHEGQAVGFTQLYPSFTSAGMARIFILNDLFVVPAARKLGVGSALLKAAADYGKQAGAVRLQLETATTNHTAQSVYEQLGWKRSTEWFIYEYAL